VSLRSARAHPNDDRGLGYSPTTRGVRLIGSPSPQNGRNFAAFANAIDPDRMFPNDDCSNIAMPKIN